MLGTIRRSTSDGLAYEKHGDGVPVVFLHGLTFNRTTWRPVIERLGEDVCSIAFDLPGHGETGGAACTLRSAAARVNAALENMGIAKPVIVGHSISSGIASIYAASYPVSGLVNVEGTVDIREIAALVQRLEPVLQSERFAAGFAPFQQSMGFEHVPEPLRTQVLESQDIRQAVVLGYWQQLLRTDPCELQAEIEIEMGRISAPCLSVFGHTLSDADRNYLQEHVSDVLITEWPDRGHHVHLAEADRFAAHLRSFIDQCRHDGDRPHTGRENAITSAR
jgi:pimeloyl-ACP methyl ester carboxylesterase